MTRRRRANPTAFTLFELVLVMAILCIVMALAAPSFSRFGRARRAGDCAAQLVALAHWARTQAVTRSTTYRLNLDPTTGQYWLTGQLQTGGPSEPLGEEFGRTFTAPEGVTLAWDAPERPEGRYVEFLPSGRTEPAVIRLTDAGNGGTVIEVACLSATELFHVVTATEEQSGGAR